MGQAKSTSVINSLSEQIFNITSTTVQECLVSVDQTQNNEINLSGTGIGNTVSVSQATEVSSTCLSNTAKQTEIQNNIINALANSAEAKAALGSSESDAVTNISNIVRANVTMSNIQRNTNIIKQTQNNKINISGTQIGNTVDISQGAQVFAASTLKSLESSGIFNTIKTDVDNKAKSEGYDPLAGITTTWIYIIIAFVVLAITGIVLVFTVF